VAPRDDEGGEEGEDSYRPPQPCPPVATHVLEPLAQVSVEAEPTLEPRRRAAPATAARAGEADGAAVRDDDRRRRAQQQQQPQQERPHAAREAARRARAAAAVGRVGAVRGRIGAGAGGGRGSGGGRRRHLRGASLVALLARLAQHRRHLLVCSRLHRPDLRVIGLQVVRLLQQSHRALKVARVERALARAQRLLRRLAVGHLQVGRRRLGAPRRLGLGAHARRRLGRRALGLRRRLRRRVLGGRLGLRLRRRRRLRLLLETPRLRVADLLQLAHRREPPVLERDLQRRHHRRHRRVDVGRQPLLRQPLDRRDRTRHRRVVHRRVALRRRARLEQARVVAEQLLQRVDVAGLRSLEERGARVAVDLGHG